MLPSNDYIYTEMPHSNAKIGKIIDIVKNSPASHE